MVDEYSTTRRLGKVAHGEEVKLTEKVGGVVVILKNIAGYAEMNQARTDKECLEKHVVRNDCGETSPA